MKSYIVFLFLAIIPLQSFSQSLKLADETQKRIMLQKIAERAASLKTLQCDFEQVKHLSMLNDKIVSKGKMYYKQSSMLRWEYNTPYNYVFIFNGTKVLLKSGQKKDIIDVKSSRLFQEIARIMMNTVTGKCLTDNADFKVALYTKDNEWIAKLTPQKKEMKQIFKIITLHFDPEIKSVSAVEMEEKSGDVTDILLKNAHYNVAVNEKVFDLD